MAGQELGGRVVSFVRRLMVIAVLAGIFSSAACFGSDQAGNFSGWGESGSDGSGSVPLMPSANSAANDIFLPPLFDRWWYDAFNTSIPQFMGSAGGAFLQFLLYAGVEKLRGVTLPSPYAPGRALVASWAVAFPTSMLLVSVIGQEEWRKNPDLSPSYRLVFARVNGNAWAGFLVTPAVMLVTFFPFLVAANRYKQRALETSATELLLARWGEDEDTSTRWGEDEDTSTPQRSVLKATPPSRRRGLLQVSCL